MPRAEKLQSERGGDIVLVVVAVVVVVNVVNM